MTLIWRTAGAWGAGSGSDLAPAEVDGNFWDLDQRVALLEGLDLGVGIDYFEIVGNQLTVHMTDHSTRGPYVIPTALFLFRGAWAADTVYLINDIFTNNGSTYLVLYDHTSDASFDPGANDGSGHDYYGLLLTNPGNVLPLGGEVDVSNEDDRQYLGKASDDDLDVDYYWLYLANLHDVSLIHLEDGQLLTYDLASDKWVNSTDANIVLTTQQDVVQSGATLAIDREDGEICALSLTATITAFTVTGWPADGLLGRIMLHVNNSGAFNITDWPNGTIWAGGSMPTVTSGASKKDVFLLQTYDGGTVIYGSIVGQDFS